MINGATQAALTKLDILYPQCAGIREYDRLPKEAKEFIDKVENAIGIPVTLIGTGPEVLDLIDLREKS